MKLNYFYSLGFFLILFTFQATTTDSLTTTDFAEKTDCSIMEKGFFFYGAADDKVKVVIKGKSHTEYHNKGKFVIKSEMDWINECEYNMKMKKVTIPDFPFGPGEIMNVKINKVDGDNIYYTSTVRGQSWEGMMTKQKK